MEEELYTQRYCAFLDILGFRQLIEGLTAGPGFQRLHTALQRIHSDHENISSDIRSQSISDAVALSTKVNAEGLQNLFTAIRRLYIDLLIQGFFLRGAVAMGLLYHDKQTIFGPGLVRAYTLESEIARFPRIIVAREVREAMLHYASNPKNDKNYPKMTELRPANDGPMFLDVLAPVIELLKKRDSLHYKLDEQENAIAMQYVSIRDQIQRRYEETMDTPRHFEKVRWFAEHWNDVIPERLHLRVLGIGLHPLKS